MKDPWLLRRLRHVVFVTPAGARLVGMNPDQYCKLWVRARKGVQLAAEFAPYCLRRGGATALFQHAGSFAKVAERGRWHSERAMRCCINSALNDVGKDSVALDLAEQRRLADQLRLLPVKG